MDLGPCPKIHSDRILAQFNEAAKQPHPDPRIGVYRQEHENVLYGYIEDCDRRIRMSQRKLEKTPEENRKTVDLVSSCPPTCALATLDSRADWTDERNWRD